MKPAARIRDVTGFPQPMCALRRRSHRRTGMGFPRVVSQSTCVAVGELLGRATELESIGAFVEHSKSGPADLVIEGEAGIGKTTVWREALRLAENHGIRVLSCRGAETEAKLSFAGLADLLEPVPDEALDSLPGPQRRALDVALLRTDPEGTAPDPRAVATAFRSVLMWLGTSPTLVAIDDAHWLDRSSASAIEFAFRRRGDSKLALLASCRPSSAVLAAVLSDADRVDLGPLSLGAVHELVKGRLGRSLPRPLLMRIYESAHGNPFYVLEISREVLHVALEPGDPLPVPRTLSQLIQRRIARLPKSTRDALLIAAIVAQPDYNIVVDALGSGAWTALERAEQAGIVETAGDSLRFSHPLFAAAVQAAAPGPRRRQMHRVVAKVIDEPEARASSDRKRSYLVECYWPGVSEASLATAARRVRLAAAELRRHGHDVAFLSSILVPADETVFCLFEGCETDVRAVSEQAGMPFERVLESLRIDGRDQGRKAWADS